MLKSINELLARLKTSASRSMYSQGEWLYKEGRCQVLSLSNNVVDLVIDHDEDAVEVGIEFSTGKTNYLLNGKKNEWDAYGIAALMQVKEELKKTESSRHGLQGKAYTRAGMIKRVLSERMEKADKAKYKIRFADNIYGEHILTNEKGTHYKITLRNFKNETGYIDNPDLKVNKLGTTKHIMFAFARLKANKKLYARLGKKISIHRNLP